MSRLALSLAAVFGLLHLAGTTDVLSEATRPLVVGLLQVAGVAAADHGDALSVGRLVVPWTRDCAGLNVLAMLWAVILWANRAHPLSGRTWLQLLLAIPVAFVANVARILTLIAFRATLYPAVESPPLHYFIGFLWVMPFLGLWVPPRGESRRGRFIEALYLASVLALLAPHVGGPGGSLVALAALVALAHGRFGSDGPSTSLLGGAAWLTGGVLVGVTRMESLWVAWLLACPRFASPVLLRSWSGVLLLAGTVPLFAMHPILRVAVVAAIGWRLWHLARGIRTSPAPSTSRSTVPPLWQPALSAALACTFLFPFVSSAFGRERPPETPPPGTMARRIDPTSYAMRLVGQPPDVEVAWFAASGDGRHHTLPVCLRYRGVVLEPSSEEAVMTDGARWMREFFVHDGVLVADYSSYLRRTLLPFSSAGIHVIVSAPVDSMSASSFADTSGSIARELDRLVRTAS